MKLWSSIQLKKLKKSKNNHSKIKNLMQKLTHLNLWLEEELKYFGAAENTEDGTKLQSLDTHQI